MPIGSPATTAAGARPTPASSTSKRRGMRRPHPGLVLALSCAAQSMVGLDIAIVNVALPSIQRDLGLGQSSLQWVVVVCGLLLGGFLLVGGRMTALWDAVASCSQVSASSPVHRYWRVWRKTQAC